MYTEERKVLFLDGMKEEVENNEEEMFEKYRQHIEFLEQLTPGVDAEAGMMQQTDHDAYAERLSDSIAELVKEDFDFDVKENTAPVPAPDALADTQVFAKAVQSPKIQHVSLGDDTENQTEEINTDDLLDSLAAELEDEALLTEE